MNRTMILGVLLWSFTLLPTHAFEPQIGGKPQRPRIIAVSTAGPTVDYLIKNSDVVERMLPTDGMVVFVNAKGILDGKPATANRHTLFANWQWDREWFEPSLNELKKIEFKQLTDNFIYVAVTGASYDMFDDVAWNKVYHNIGIMSWYAKEVGFKGIFLDIEHYTKGQHALFAYNPEGGHSFDEVWAKAYHRGREFMNAMVARYPDITIIGAFGLSANFGALSAADPMEYLKNTSYGLAVAFYNGIYDVMPAGARFMDGCEGPGYIADGLLSFVQMSEAFFRNSPQLLTRSNRGKFHSQSGLSPGLFLDCYINEEGFHVIKSPAMSRLNLFRNNLGLAVKYSHGYVWLYSEQCRWFPAKMAPGWEKAVLSKPGRGRLWEEAVPGITEAVEFVRNPEATVAGMLKENRLEEVFSVGFEPGEVATTGTETALPADCKASTALEGVFTWQSGSYQPQGTFERDATVGYESGSSAKLTGIEFGCVGRMVPVKPGQVYYVTAVAKSKGMAKAALSVSWQNAEEKWVKEQCTVRAIYAKVLKAGWKRAAEIVTVPQDVYYMSVQCSNHTYGGVEADNICWFDAFKVYKVF